MTDAAITLLSVVGQALTWWLNAPGLPRKTLVFVQNKTELVVNSFVVGSITKSGKLWTVAPVNGCSIAPITAKTRKEAIARFAYLQCVYIYSRAAEPSRGRVVPTPCNTCGHEGCVSRFDCSPGAPNFGF